MQAFKATVLVVVSLFVMPAWSSSSSELNHFFSQLGFASNMSAPRAYQTQAAGFVTSGGAYLRNQVRNIQVMHIDTPGFRSGCGGIDIIAGGFSFISSDQITQFMQSVLSSGAGYALNLALETELPEIAHSLQYMQKLANDINRSNMGSCEMGESLVGGLWSKNRMASQQICEDIGLQDGVFSDWAKARQQCSTGGAIESQLDRATDNPAYKDRVLYNSNVVWEALEANDFLKRDPRLAEAYLSISGTVVFDKKGGISSYPSLARNSDFIRAMLYGGDLLTYRCKDVGSHSKCLQVEYSANTHQTIAPSDALVPQVQALFQGIYDNIVQETPLTPAQNGLIGMTQSAVFNMIASSAELHTGIEGSYVLAESVATELLAQYLQNALDVIRGSLATRKLGDGNEKQLFDGLRDAEKAVSDFASASRDKLNQALLTNRLIEGNVKKSLSALSPMLRAAYSGEGV